MHVLVLPYPRMISCDACLGFQDDELLVHLSLGSVACGVRAAGMLQLSNSGGFLGQGDLMTGAKCSLKRVPSHFNAQEDMRAACYRVRRLGY